jgi:hypothetical protein
LFVWFDLITYFQFLTDCPAFHLLKDGVSMGCCDGFAIDLDVPHKEITN